MQQIVENEPSNITNISALSEQVEKFRSFLSMHEQIDLRTKHFLVTGPDGLNLYAREITIPARSYLAGASHKRDYLVTCIGDIEVTTDDGIKRLTGRHTFVAKAGLGRCGSAHADTIWTTYHVVTAQTIIEIEDELTDESNLLQTRNLSLGMDEQQLIEA